MLGGNQQLSGVGYSVTVTSISKWGVFVLHVYTQLDYVTYPKDGKDIHCIHIDLPVVVIS